MPGLAKTNAFMLGTATVMVGPVEDLQDLNPLEHSIGLVKNFTISSDPAYTELTQGVKNDVVDSTMTGNPTRCSMEAYEYTARNFAYALGLEKALDISPTGLSVKTTTAGSIAANAVAVPVALATGLTVGKYIMIAVDNEDHFIIRKITGVATNTLTVDAAVPAIPANSVVTLVQDLSIGSKDDQPYYSAAISGKLSNNDKIVIQLPKIRIVKGFNVAFTSGDYANMPIEFTIYDQVSTDPFYAQFGGAKAKIFRT